MMAEVLLTSDTKNLELGHFAALDIELNAAIIELVYLTCLTFSYGKPEDIYLSKHDSQIRKVSYTNPFDIMAFFGNITKDAAQWVLDRTLFYKEEKAKRRAEAEKIQAEAEGAHQTAIEKKLKNIDLANKTRAKLIKGGIDPEEASKIIGALLFDQHARLEAPRTGSPQKAL